ncbi:unnamed protein product [Prorocentrum cordatum]|uniref:Uncharacterized protein n=1 Tax=Prorocentrum cordatum TaxID=2364126 RepID=A0ABN9SU76_9DINO|nr:unnamed protein product [Polarella glacialis]
MPHHAALMARLDRAGQREAALKMITAVLHGDVPLVDRPTVQRLLALCDRLIRDRGGEDNDAAPSRPGDMQHLEHDPDAFAAEQVLVARLVHQVAAQGRAPRSGTPEHALLASEGSGLVLTSLAHVGPLRRPGRTSGPFRGDFRRH